MLVRKLQFLVLITSRTRTGIRERLQDQMYKEQSFGDRIVDIAFIPFIDHKLFHLQQQD